MIMTTTLIQGFKSDNAKAVVEFTNEKLVIDVLRIAQDEELANSLKGYRNRAKKSGSVSHFVERPVKIEGKYVHVFRSFDNKEDAFNFRNFLFSLPKEDFLYLKEHLARTSKVEFVEGFEVVTEIEEPVVDDVEVEVGVEEEPDSLTLRKAQGYYDMYRSFGYSIKEALDRIESIYDSSVSMYMIDFDREAK